MVYTGRPPWYSNAQVVQSGHFRIDLLDDSEKNLAVAALVGIRGTRVCPEKGFPVEHALLKVLGVIPDPATWAFDSVKYLRAKNEIDRKAFSASVQACLERELASIDTGGGPVRIVDVGAGCVESSPRC